MTFFDFFMFDDLPFINTMQKTLKPSKKCFNAQNGWEKNIQHIAIEKDNLSELNRCIFPISLKYIKLVIPKKHFILVLCSFNFYFKLRDLPPIKKFPLSIS